MAKKVLLAMPPAMLEQVDFVAEVEHRTRSDLMREAIRRYLDNFRRSERLNSQAPTPPQITQAPPAPVQVNEPKEEDQPEPIKEVSSPVVPFFNRTPVIG